jgi:hypothetical protein
LDLFFGEFTICLWHKVFSSMANKRVKIYERVKAHGKWTSVSVEIPTLKPDNTLYLKDEREGIVNPTSTARFATRIFREVETGSQIELQTVRQGVHPGSAGRIAQAMEDMRREGTEPVGTCPVCKAQNPDRQSRCGMPDLTDLCA